MQLKYLFPLFITTSLFISLVSSFFRLSSSVVPRGYNVSEMPRNTNGDGRSSPVNIVVDMSIRGISFATPYDMNTAVVSVSLKITLSWQDSRLKQNRATPDDYTFLTDDAAIWTPSVTLMVDKEATFRYSYFSVRIYPNSTIIAEKLTEVHVIHPGGQTWKVRITALSIRLMSVHHTMDNLTLQWREVDPFEVAGATHIERAGLNSEEFRKRTCHVSVSAVSRGHSGNHSCLEFYFEEKKSSSVYIVYIPGIIAVVISWVFFWIFVPSMLADVAIFTACMLHLFLQKVSIVKDLSLLENHETLNYWLDVCIGFVFAAFIAIIGVTYLCLRSGQGIRRRSGEEILFEAATIQEEEEESIVESSDGEANTQRNRFNFLRIWFNRFPTADQINAICRVLFPLCFVIFLCVFFADYY